ncbi:very short patch repair endonuclease [Edwardsiella ictaluri]|uniref:very short patch repair endonuclease n=1 Tax=Edwardsiella ictaluri TaxID=67780 RepID=UPI000300640C|nr:very short patch repair endonuclease [Edwardsiella ictaluri]AVZ81046.1 very short patch repair endonuclease [Edwardsiella ictaluri]EKS7764180.1 DNA mismatch endonuclease Vsr [Edwardsiella ictaluri]EKS7771039.1 DNA mismatch endonuclease Vsr [Edwardsiella ictaluri]EKS7774131.1 DNA mismatch endonuclease Vsr [Edwardsiella ictaluri]EKS7777464.1 DNA mismatch endonuclease Vsr [Edwardsiella ictaluri]
MDKESARSRNMKAIKNRDTKPEMQIRRALHAHGFRYRLSPPTIPGKPDLWLPAYHAAIFINGCFWHAHGCSLFRFPINNSEFWVPKLTGNATRDLQTYRTLYIKKIRTLVIWECALKGKHGISDILITTLIATWLKADQSCGFITCDGLTSGDTPDLKGMIGIIHTENQTNYLKS